MTWRATSTVTASGPGRRGATIVAEPEDQFYGDRTYRAVDPEGHVWTFSQHVRDVGRAEAEEARGVTIKATNWA